MILTITKVTILVMSTAQSKKDSRINQVAVNLIVMTLWVTSLFLILVIGTKTLVLALILKQHGVDLLIPISNRILLHLTKAILQDLGMGEMFAEGKSKVHIHVNTKSKFKSLLQRLIVNVSQNKGWKVAY